MKKILLFLYIPFLFCNYSMAQVYESNQQQVQQYVDSLPVDKRQIAEYIIKNNPNQLCFSYSDLKSINTNSVIKDDSKIIPNISSDVCGLASKVSFIESGENILIKIFGQSFSNNDNIEIPKILNANNQDVKPIKVLLKDNKTEKTAIPSDVKVGAKKLEKGNWVLTLIYSKIDFDNVKSISFDKEKDIPIIDDSSFSKSIIRNGDSLVIRKKEKQSVDTVGNNKDREYEIKVFRKLDRNIPYTLETVIEVNGYKEQEVINLGKINPDGFTLLNISRDVKIQENNGDYLATIGLGKNTIVMQAISKTPITEFKSPLVPGVTQELWSISTTGGVIDIVGLEATNAQIAEIPNQWRNLPTYVRSGDFSLLEKKNELKEQEYPVSTQLSRQTWFDSNGKSYSNNQLRIINNPSNLQFISQNEKNSVNISGLMLGNEPQVILEKDSITLVPLKGNNELSYSFESNNYQVPTNIWNTNENVESWKINLSPRTRLIGTTDEVFAGSWIDSWNLYSVFLLVLLVVAYGKIINRKMAILVGSSTILLVSLSNLIWLWWISFLLFLLIKKGLVYLQERKTEEKDIIRINKHIKFLSCLFAIVLIVGSVQTYKLIISEVQYIINPSLELSKNRYSNYLVEQQYQASYEIASESVSKAANSITSRVVSPAAPRAPIIKENLVKSYQVGRPEPQWNTFSQNSIFLKGSVSSLSDGNVKFYVAPIWLVNITGFVQILMSVLLMTMGWIVTYVLISKNERLKHSKFYTFFFGRV